MTRTHASSKSLVEWYLLKNLGDQRGGLVALESTQTPFVFERLYYIYGTGPKVSRGHHAHRTLRQLAVCAQGSCVMTLDNGTEQEDVVMDSPLKALFIEPMIWHSMKDFSHDCILLVLASAAYDEGDYIRDYGSFLKHTMLPLR